MAANFIKKEDVSTDNIYGYEYEDGAFSGYWLKFKYVSVPMDTRDPFNPVQNADAEAVYDAYIFDTEVRDVKSLIESLSGGQSIDFFYVEESVYQGIVADDPKFLGVYSLIPYQITDKIMTVNKYYLPADFDIKDYEPEDIEFGTLNLTLYVSDSEGNILSAELQTDKDWTDQDVSIYLNDSDSNEILNLIMITDEEDPTKLVLSDPNDCVYDDVYFDENPTGTCILEYTTYTEGGTSINKICNINYSWTKDIIEVTNRTDDSEYYMYNCNGYNENVRVLASEDQYNTGFNVPKTIEFQGHLDDTIDLNAVSQVGDNDLGYIFMSTKYDASIPFYVKLFANSADGQTVSNYKIKVSMLNPSKTSQFGWMAVGELDAQAEEFRIINNKYTFTFDTATYHNDSDNTDTDYITLNISFNDRPLIGNKMSAANAAQQYGKSVMVNKFYNIIEQFTGTRPSSGSLATVMQTQTDEDAVIPFMSYVLFGGSLSVDERISPVLGDISQLIESNSVKFFRVPDTENNEVIYPSYYTNFDFIDENDVANYYVAYYDKDDSYGLKSMGKGFVQVDLNGHIDMETAIFHGLQAPEETQEDPAV